MKTDRKVAPTTGRNTASLKAGEQLPLRVAVERGGATVWATATRSGDDLVVVVGGGDSPHVGCVAMAQPRPSTADLSRTSATVSLLAIPPHKEGDIAARLARNLAVATGGVVVVSAGIHDDGLSAAGIAVYLELMEQLEAKLLEALRS